MDRHMLTILQYPLLKLVKVTMLCCVGLTLQPAVVTLEVKHNKETGDTQMAHWLIAMPVVMTSTGIEGPWLSDCTGGTVP